jgi:3-oxoacyl-[acyl-carrier-protein] synthase-3
MQRSKITASGAYLPEKIITNHDLAKTIDTSDEWIFDRTGIKQRHIAAEGEFTSDLAYKAALDAIKNAGVDKEEIDLIIVATTTPDNIFPSTATKVQHKLGLTKGFAFDVQAVCSGFIYALTVADSLIKTGQAKKALVIGAETMSRIIDWQDRNTCVLFGDGAGAVILEKSDDESGIIHSHLYSDGSYYDMLKTNGGPSLNGGHGTVEMSGKEVFKNAVTKMASSVEKALQDTDLSTSDIDLLIPHQANIRILDAVAKKLHLNEKKLVVTIARHANTSAASIPLALNEALLQGRVKKDDLLVFEALGAGLTWGTIILKW